MCDGPTQAELGISAAFDVIAEALADAADWRGTGLGGIVARIGRSGDDENESWQRGDGNPGLRAVARELAMSTSTVRQRLERTALERL